MSNSESPEKDYFFTEVEGEILLGNRQGLADLRDAISVALENGESNINTGSINKVICQETSEFVKDNSYKSKFSDFMALLMGAIFLFTFITGIFTIIMWVFPCTR